MSMIFVTFVEDSATKSSCFVVCAKPKEVDPLNSFLYEEKVFP